jgi:hypothetical protein
MEESLTEMEGLANGNVMCVAIKTGVSVPHLVSNHPPICSPPSAWHCRLSVRTYGILADVDAQTWGRSFINRLLTRDFEKSKLGSVFLRIFSPKIIQGLRRNFVFGFTWKILGLIHFKFLHIACTSQRKLRRDRPVTQNTTIRGDTATFRVWYNNFTCCYMDVKFGTLLWQKIYWGFMRRNSCWEYSDP